MSVTLFLVATLFGLLGCIFYWLHRHFQYFEVRGIAYEKPNYILGNFNGIHRTRSFVEIYSKIYKKFKGTGPFCGFFWFQRPSAFILDTQLAKNILIKDFNNFVNRGFYTNAEDDPLTGQLFLLEGHRWRTMRNKLSPTFTSGKMKYMFPTVLHKAEELVRILSNDITQEPNVEIRDCMGRYTTDVIGTCAFGINVNCLQNPDDEFRQMNRRVFTDQRLGRLGFALLNSFPKFCRKIHMKSTPDHITDFYMTLVRQNIAHREKNNIRRNDFFDMLLDLKNNKLIKTVDGEDMSITVEEMAAQAFVFLVAGFETSSTTMGFALYELAQYDDIQQRVRDEITATLAKHNGEFTYECMKEMVYLEQVISETLRLYTVLPVLNRVCMEDYVVPGNPTYVIPKGMHVVIPSGAFHRSADLYPNPDEFNPDNFTPEKVAQRDGIEWLPFGEGPRNCIGMRFGQMQVRVGLALLLKNFKFSVCGKTPIPMTYNKKSFIVSSEHDIYLYVKKV
ncbi:probable cytochrome P450 6a21 [Eurosta solidaginis]|uniref:probable cytochrome P450 6a21 n=1 Tax=Eurosta solidaginis TaxID=178769 RepID=UPI003530DC56